MRYKKLGYSDLSLSVIGLGTWAMGGGDWKYGWGPQDDQQSIQTIYRALDLGVNWIDTAAVYGLGHAEEVVGQALRGLSERPIIATKCGRKQNAAGQLYSELKRQSVIEEAEGSLRRLGVEVIDLYQVHWPKPDEDIEEAWEAMVRLIEQGKVRYGGVSNFSIEQMQRCQAIHPIASLQPPYNMLVRDIEKGTIDYCGDNDIGIICYSPLYKGLFTGAFSHERLAALPDADHRRNDPHFQEPELTANLQLVDGLKKIAAARGVSVAQLTIAWTLRRPQMTAAIVGGRRPQQVDETAAAGDIVLDESEIEQINALVAARDEAVKNA